MRRFSEEDVKGILSQRHLGFTADALGKDPTDVTAEDLISHWLRFHIAADVVRFNVTEEDNNEHLFT